MGADGARDLEVLFRVCSAVHYVFRQYVRAPLRGEVVAMGADGSPTERLDRVAESQLLAALDAEQVDWNVLSEEAGEIARGGDRLLVVDPIDGSHNALRELPFATVSLALGRRDLGGVDVGVVHDLHRGTTYWATRGGGAFRDGKPIRTRAWEPPRELYFVNLGRHASEPAVKLAAKGRRIRSLGCASFELLMVAQGGADAYLFDNDTPERNLRVTDIAAAALILEEAGGGVSDRSFHPLGGMPLALGRRTSVLGWGDPKFPKAAAELGLL
ncbi:MAG TPA: inositol monophosphatase family protein [Thermoplasmata archaeon]|nr:inositol monophosphatase family protein [Thermoplasmata archaeon]